MKFLIYYVSVKEKKYLLLSIKMKAAEILSAF